MVSLIFKPELIHIDFIPHPEGIFQDLIIYDLTKPEFVVGNAVADHLYFNLYYYFL
jgi:hypothetical protein